MLTDVCPEDLYQQIVSFFDDNLVTADSGLAHHGARVLVDEEMTPSIENIIVLLWLERIHSGLPGLVKQMLWTKIREHYGFQTTGS